jgi:hypothetical protein
MESAVAVWTKTRNLPLHDLAADIARYEQMSAAEVDAELSEHGIDPTSTIEAVTALVRAHLDPCTRRSLHRPLMRSRGRGSAGSRDVRFDAWTLAAAA